MSDPVAKVEADVKADAAKVETAASADVAKAESAVSKFVKKVGTPVLVALAVAAALITAAVFVH